MTESPIESPDPTNALEAIDPVNEADEADVVEQHTPAFAEQVGGYQAPSGPPLQVKDLEADEADVLEQAQIAAPEEEDYPRG